MYCICSCWFAEFLFLFLGIITSPGVFSSAMILYVVPFRRMQEYLYYFCTDVLYCTVLYYSVLHCVALLCAVQYPTSSLLPSSEVFIVPDLSITLTHFSFMFTNHTHLFVYTYIHTHTHTQNIRSLTHILAHGHNST